MITALDASTGREITGKLIKRYPNGITIEDARDIRYYVTMERVRSGLEPERKAPLTPGENAAIW